MFDSLVLTLTLALAIPSDSSDREWAVNRPSRGTQASVVLKAATVPASIRSFASCVINRESGGNLNDTTSGMGARNPVSSASGRWQFLDTSWRRGLSFMVRDRLVQFGMPKANAREAREWLGAHHISTWPGILQDVGFVEVMERGGKHHWNGGPHSC